MPLQKRRVLNHFTLFFTASRNLRREGALTPHEGKIKEDRGGWRMSRNRLLLAVAAAALIAGTSGTFAQQEPNAGKEKSAPSTLSKPGAGAVQQNPVQQNRSSQQGQQGGRVGQSDRRETSGPPDHSKTTGQAPSVTDKAGEKAGELKAGEKAIEKKAGSATRDRQTTGQNQNEKGIRGERERSTTGQAGQGERRDNVERDRTQTDRDRVQGQRNEGREGREGGRSQTNVNVELSSAQRTRIHDVIVKERGAPRVANVDFSLTIGTLVPRSIRLVAVPTTIVTIEPTWRGFDYFLVGDEIVIVDPRTLEIVAVIPA
jgi:hypothetical protein